MEAKKYSQPFMSESLAEMATFIGCVKNSTTTDALSRKEASLGRSSDDEANDKQSVFSRFTSSKRPPGYFGTQIGELH